MSHHEWGDTDFDWDALDKAGKFIQKFCHRAANLNIMWKEKYGTLRETVFWNHESSLVNLHWQEYVYGQAHLRAIKKWPHLTQEILEDADYPQFIPGFDKLVNDENKYV